MKAAEVKYLKARVSGYFKPILSKHTGNFELSQLNPQAINLFDVEEVSPFVFDALKVGSYFFSNKPFDKARVYVSDTQFIEQQLTTYVFTELKQEDTIEIAGESYVKYSGICYFIATKKEAIKTEPVQEDSKIFRFLPRKLFTILGLGNRYDTWRTGGSTITTVQGGSVNSSNPFWNILRLVIFGLLFFLLFRALPTHWLILSFLWFLAQIVKELSVFNTAWSVRNTLLNYLAWILLFVGAYGAVTHHFSKIYLLLFLLGVGLLLASRFGRKLMSSGWVVFSSALLVIYLLNKEDHFKDSDKQGKNEGLKTEDKWDYNPKIEEDTVHTDDKDTLNVNYLSHSLSWKNNFKRNFKTILKVREDSYHLAQLEHENTQIENLETRRFYNKVYNNLIAQNKDKLPKVLAAYAKKGKEKKLSRNEFADMIVSSIQSIPYCMVHDYSHEKADEVYGGSIREYHETGGPCLENIKFGVQSPVEFIGNFKGDCDTRSLLLYYILSSFGYDCVVLVSSEYSHSILGIAGNYSGDYVSYKGTKYYGWETTAKFYTAGNLPSSCNNMRYWEVALGNMNN